MSPSLILDDFLYKDFGGTHKSHHKGQMSNHVVSIVSNIRNCRYQNKTHDGRELSEKKCLLKTLELLG